MNLNSQICFCIPVLKYKTTLTVASIEEALTARSREIHQKREPLKNVIGEYIHFYNDERITKKNGLTLFEIRSQAT